MHPVITMKSWSHHMHDGMLTTWHHIDQHLRSRHFWAGVGITLLVAGIVMLFILAAKYAPEMEGTIPLSYPYVPIP